MTSQDNLRERLRLAGEMMREGEALAEDAQSELAELFRQVQSEGCLSMTEAARIAGVRRVRAYRWMERTSRTHPRP